MKKTFIYLLSIITTASAYAVELKKAPEYNKEATLKLQAAIHGLKTEEEIGSADFFKTVDTLVNQGANPNVGREGAPDGLLIFLVAAPRLNENLDRTLQETVVKTVLEHGANPNIGDERGNALHYAIAGGSSSAIITLLIDHGARASHQSQSGKTVLEEVEHALQEEKSSLAQLEQKTIPNTQNNIDRLRKIRDSAQSLRNSVGIAARTIQSPQYNQQATKQLQEKLNLLKSEEEISSTEFLTSLNQLIIDGADPNTAFQGNKEVTLLMLLCKAPHWNDAIKFQLLETVINAALRAGANPNVQDGQGDTPLTHTLWIGSANTAKLLIEYGADPLAKDANGIDFITKAEQRLQAAIESIQRTYPSYIKEHQRKIRYLEEIQGVLKEAIQKNNRA